MSPEELAARHPRLYHVTRPHVLPIIEKHGLLSTSHLLSLFEVPEERRKIIESDRRSMNVTLIHPVHGAATLTDQHPLSLEALAGSLDDGLKPADWIRLLNRRVFFWVDPKRVDLHLRTSIKRSEPRIVLVLDALSLIRQHYDQIEISPFNTGSTLRRPARRGLSTFTPLHRHNYRDWQRLRGGHDQVRELTVIGSVQDVNFHLTGFYPFPHLESKYSGIFKTD